MKKKQAQLLPLDARLDVYAFKGDRIRKKTMTNAEYMNLGSIKGWRVDAYQEGFYSIKPTE